MTTVGSGPASIAAAITAWWPTWTPSKVPIATARGSRSSSAGCVDVHRFLGPELEHRSGTALGNAGERVGRQSRERHRDAQQPLPVGLLDPERPDRGAAQRPAMTAEAAAIERTYVPELDVQRELSRPRRATTTSSAETCERRSGISTTVPRRASP